MKLESPTKQFINSLLNHGASIEEIAESFGMTVDQIIDIRTVKTITKRIDRSFLQCRCPFCDVIVLSGECAFSQDDNDDRIKINHSYCWSCRSGIIFKVTKKGIKTKRPSMIFTFSAGGGCPQVRGTTDIYQEYDSSKIRMGFSIMGSVNFESMIGACPFDPNYHDNYVESDNFDGLKKKIEEISRSVIS